MAKRRYGVCSLPWKSWRGYECSGHTGGRVNGGYENERLNDCSTNGDKQEVDEKKKKKKKRRGRREEGEIRSRRRRREGVRGGQERGRNDGLFPLWHLPESLGHRALFLVSTYGNYYLR